VTISMAWVRKVAGGCEELVVATDSRLRFGCAWDCCPKILLLPRTDSVICFAGDTDYAYPLMLQMGFAIDTYQRSRDRAMDIHDLRGHTLKIFNHMRDFIHNLPRNQMEPETPKTTFILGGYSWIRKTFAIWTLHFDENIRQFTYRPSRKWIGNFEKIAFAGDRDSVHKARKRLIRLLRERHNLTSQGSDAEGFDMEPFEVLRDMLRESTPSSSIGGPPQVVKVYQHMNSRPFGVYWPNKESQQITVLGRPLLGYETPRWWVLNPDTLETTPPPLHHE
jgi:hypothetical protein